MALVCEISLVRRYFGGSVMAVAQDQVQRVVHEATIGMARGAQVLGFRDPELLEELQLAAEPPGPQRRSKYAGDPEGVSS